MKIPKDPGKLRTLARNLWRELDNREREERRQDYARLRQWQLTGSEFGEMALYNKIAETVETSASFLFAAEAARFSVVLDPEYGDEFIEEQAFWANELHRLYHDGGVGQTSDLAVEWGHVYPSIISKVLVTGGRVTAENHKRRIVGGHIVVDNLADPSDLCVPQPDLPGLDDQEVIAHFYSVNLHRFARMVYGHTDEARLLALAADVATPGGPRQSLVLPPAISSLLIAQSSPEMVGAARGNVVPRGVLATARVEEPLVQMVELWIRDDDTEDDYRVVTLMLPHEEVIGNDPNPLVKGMHPFCKLTLLECLGYFWGLSLIDGLLLLQQWRERRMNGIDHILDLQEDPPFAYIGVTGLFDQKGETLRTPGADVPIGNPLAKVERFAPQMPPDAFAEIKELDLMFANRIGLPQVNQGLTTPELRGGDQVGKLAMLGSSRLAKRAMRVESWQGAIATRMIRLHRNMTDAEIKTKSRGKVLASQIPESFVAQVSSHTASPLYAERDMQKGIILHQGKAITDERFVRMVNPSDVETAVAEARRIAENKAAAQKKLIEIQEERARHGKGR